MDKERVLRLAKVAKIHLVALVPDPNKPDWMPALDSRNPADARCLDNVLSCLEDIINEIDGSEATC